MTAPVEILSLEGDAAFFDDRDALRTALGGPAPGFPPWFGYDATGSALFEEITELPTYHLTRAEDALLRRHADDLAGTLDGARLAELGSGSAKKTRVLLAACTRRAPMTYLPVDVSREMLESSAATLTAELPGLAVRALWGRYEAGLEWLRADLDGCTVIALLGSNLGNATPDERAALLDAIAAALSPGDGFLVSADLLKPGAALETCYNDPAPYEAFARFRRNHLTHLNRRFGADAAPERFTPRAHWNPTTGAVEGHLWSAEGQTVRVPGLDLTLRLRAGDSIGVGVSAKFDQSALVAELAGHRLRVTHEWIDPVCRYGLFLARRA